jgi:hypothetical protein
MIVLKCTTAVEMITNRMITHIRGSIFQIVKRSKPCLLISGLNAIGIKMGNEKNTIYGQMYSICGRWIVAT